MKRRRHVVAPQEAGLLVPLVAHVLERPLSEAAELVTRGAVYLDGRRLRDPRRMVSAGQVLLVVLEEGGRDALAPPAPHPGLRILYRDEALLAVNKPAALPAQPTPGASGGDLLSAVSAQLGREAGLVHRLDRDTTGVTVFGLTPRATSALAEQFREGTARKRYLAACGPALGTLGEAGEVDLPLSKDPSRPGRYRATRAAHGVPALTHWRRLAAHEDHALVALFPQTGRTHQLRAHLAALGAPLCGDLKYGGPRDVLGAPAGRYLLHAQALVLSHPTTGARLLIEAPVPDDLARIFSQDGVTPPSGPWD